MQMVAYFYVLFQGISCFCHHASNSAMHLEINFKISQNTVGIFV